MRGLSRRIQRVEASKTFAITERLAQLRREGVEVISLSAGEPDFPTPAHICEAAIEALRKGHTKYTPATGIHELKEAVVRKLARDNGLQYDVSEIAITCGGKQAIFNTILALCEEGDEVLIPSPYWVSYPEQVKIAGATPVFLPTDPSANFLLDPEDLRRAITPRTKLLIFNNPVNPTGLVYEEATLKAIAEVIEETGLFVLSDEIYERIVFDGLRHRSLASFPSIKDRVVLVNGVSKTYSMTGWRIGFVAAARPIIQAIAKIQGHSTSNPSTIAQWASVAALDGPQDCVDRMVREFERRRNYIFEIIQGVEGLHCQKSKGTFYLFIEVSPYLGLQYRGFDIQDSVSLCRYLLEEGVALVPGSAFGTEGYVRISFANSMKNIQMGMERITGALEKLRQGGLTSS